MKLAGEGAHHLATAAADLIDGLEEVYGEDAELTGYVLVAEVDPKGDGTEHLVHTRDNCSWPHAAGIAMAASDILRGDGDDEE